MIKFLVILGTFLYLSVEGQPINQPIQNAKLRLKISANGLPDKDKLGTTDPYVELYYTEQGSTKERKFGRTATLSDTENPVFGDIIEFDYDRSKGQRWHLKVKDHDNAREDDTVGKAWVIVDDYVDKGQIYTANLHKKGTITVQSADPVVAQILPVGPAVPIVQTGGAQPLPPVLIQQVQNPAQPQLIIQPQQQQPQRLRIKLAARGLPDTDLLGTVDPYVKAYYTDETKNLDTQFGRTAPISDKEDPNFPEILEFDYVRGKKQRWHFVLLDDDDNRRDDDVGEAFIDVDDYVAKGENAVISLKKGQLLVKRA